MRTQVKPSVYEKNLASDQNVVISACIVGKIQCQYPGNGRTNGQAKFDDYNNQQSGRYKDSENKLHGICGIDADISFVNTTGSGYEQNNGVTDTSRPIYSISGYDTVAGTYTDVTWKSKDKTRTVYTHKGRLIINQVEANRPNHSLHIYAFNQVYRNMYL